MDSCDYHLTCGIFRAEDSLIFFISSEYIHHSIDAGSNDILT